MLRHKDVEKLLNNVARKLGVTQQEAFLLACACSEPRQDGEQFLKDWEEKYAAPQWFVDILVDIMADRYAPLMITGGGDPKSMQA